MGLRHSRKRREFIVCSRREINRLGDINDGDQAIGI